MMGPSRSGFSFNDMHALCSDGVVIPTDAYGGHEKGCGIRKLASEEDELMEEASHVSGL